MLKLQANACVFHSQTSSRQVPTEAATEHIYRHKEKTNYGLQDKAQKFNPVLRFRLNDCPRQIPHLYQSSAYYNSRKHLGWHRRGTTHLLPGVCIVPATQQL